MGMVTICHLSSLTPFTRYKLVVVIFLVDGLSRDSRISDPDKVVKRYTRKNDRVNGLWRLVQTAEKALKAHSEEPEDILNNTSRS